DEVEDRSALLTTETVEDFFRRIHRKRRLGFFVKGTTRGPVGAGFLQRHIVLHDANNVRLSFQIVDESVRETHELFYELPASKIKSSALEDSSARSLNDGCLTHML